MTMMVRALFAVALLAATAVAGEEPGSLAILGGGVRFDQTDVWNQIVELSGGKGARIAVFPTASSDPMKYGSRTVEALCRAGAEAFLVPVWVDREEIDCKAKVTDPKLVADVKNCGGVFFIGGSQERITRALGSCAGERTPLLDAVWDVYRKGGVISGTSAGAAVMSRMMFRQSRSVLATLQNGVTVGNELAPGLGFMDEGWFVEQHCLTRGRFGRSLVAMHTLGMKYGVGIDDNTAIVVRGGHAMNVIGYNGVIVMDLSEATSDAAVKGFNVKNARLTFIDHGDAFDLKTRQLTPSAEKRADPAINPSSESFQPAHDSKLVSTDILGYNVLPELMSKLIDNKQPEAIGLAFDAAEAQRGSADGFEFRFYRGNDSMGWNATINGAGAYTVANIHLDVRPIEIKGPLYK